MEVDTFLDSLHIHHGEAITIVYPNKWDMENYILDLEQEYSKKYKNNLCNVSYIDYGYYKKQFNIPGYSLSDLYIVDPRCYLNELKRYDLFFDEVEKLWKRL